MNEAALRALLCREDPTEVIPTGCLSLDWALGAGGFPRGHLLEIFGPPACGKTTVALEAIAAAQRAGGTGAFLDAEHALDATWAAKLGVATENLIYLQPTGTSEALDMIVTLVKTCAVDVIVLDSVAALGSDPNALGLPAPPGARDELEYWPFVHRLRMLHTLVPRSPTCLIFLNQVRSRLGTFYGSPVTTPGAPALACMASVRIEMERRATITRDGEPVGSRVRLHVMKSFVTHLPRVISLEILAEGGICREGDLLTVGLRAGILERTEEGIRFGRTLLGRNPEEAQRQFPRGSARFAEISALLRERAGLPAAAKRAKGASA